MQILPLVLFCVILGNILKYWQTKTNKGANGFCMKSAWINFAILFLPPIEF
jgi:hypothetical protein